MKKRDIALYILMRTDLRSMNPGKAVAHGAHAATKFIYDFEGPLDKLKLNKPLHEYRSMIDEWRGNRGFGTKITLDVKGPRLVTLVKHLRDQGFPASLVKDPTYPLRDGEITHLIPLVTCGYVFGLRDELANTDLSAMELMK